MSRAKVIPVDPGCYGFTPEHSDHACSDSVVNDKYIPDTTGEDAVDWMPSMHIWAFDACGYQIARAVTHMRESVANFVTYHKQNPQVALITSRPMNLREAKETILWSRNQEE